MKASRRAATSSRKRSIYWGARIDGAYYSANYGASTTNDAPFSATDSPPRAWDLFESHAGKAVTLIHWGGPGSNFGTFTPTQATNMRNRGAFSFFTVTPSQAEMDDLAGGTNTSGINATLDAWATAAQTSGHPILLRPMHEMNGAWTSPVFPWQTNRGTTSGEYVTAWQRIWNRFAAILGGGTHTGNVSFCWCPNIQGGTVPDPSPWYPGDAYVDWLGMDGYAYTGASTPAGTVFNTTYATLQAISTTKPIAIGETACSSGHVSPTKAAWITDFLGTWLPQHPQIKAFSWFNEVGTPADPWIEDGTGAQAAFAAGIASSYFKSNIVNSTTFPSGAKVPVP